MALGAMRFEKPRQAEFLPLLRPALPTPFTPPLPITQAQGAAEVGEHGLGIGAEGGRAMAALNATRVVVEGGHETGAAGAAAHRFTSS